MKRRGLWPRTSILIAALGICVIVMTGCRGPATAPIHVWQPPSLQSVVGKRVVIAGIDGPSELTEPLIKQLIAQAPVDQGRETKLVALMDIKQHDDSIVQLASATDEVPSDVVIAHHVGQQGYEYYLRGEVMQRRHHNDLDDTNPRLTVSWRLSSLDQKAAPIGAPISIDLQSAQQIYPDLAFLADKREALLIATARETNRLIAPSITRLEVPLAVPYGLPGSGSVRRGNALARAARWQEAKTIWQGVSDRYPFQNAAVINLAIAAAAEQDFATAKQLARQAIRRSPTKLAQETLVWIELRQRDYHDAFALPPPEEGWFVTR